MHKTNLNHHRGGYHPQSVACGLPYGFPYGFRYVSRMVSGIVSRIVFHVFFVRILVSDSVFGILLRTLCCDSSFGFYNTILSYKWEGEGWGWEGREGWVRVKGWAGGAGVRGGGGYGGQQQWRILRQFGSKLMFSGSLGAGNFPPASQFIFGNFPSPTVW